jgi:pyruvate dehydrogenase E2 component (dihydrolipoamide acetyltransferase)
MAQVSEVKVPDIGNYTNVPVIEVLVKPGDTVAKDQGLVTLESDKATMEVPSPIAGRQGAEGQAQRRGSEGTVVALIEAADAAASTKPRLRRRRESRGTCGTSPQPQPSPDAGTRNAPVQAPPSPHAKARRTPAVQGDAPRSPPVAFGADTVMPDKVPYASPAIRVFARELGVDLSKVSGSGRKNRITKEDVQNFVKQAMPEAPRRALRGWRRRG